MAHHDDHIDWTQLTNDLAQPFDCSEIKYRAGAVSRDKTKAQALPYADPRSYEDRLNTLVPGHWQVEFQPWGEHRIICRLTIHDITRSSTGESSDSPDNISGTSAEAQAFKRACTKFGLGRYLYALEPNWVDYDAERRRLKPARMPHNEQAVKAATFGTHEIGPERAAGMHLTLRQAGLPDKNHERFASKVLQRQVRRLQELSEAEARAVWQAARNPSKVRAA